MDPTQVTQVNQPTTPTQELVAKPPSVDSKPVEEPPPPNGPAQEATQAPTEAKASSTNGPSHVSPEGYLE